MEKPNIFYTGNAQLAFALIMAGVELLPQRDEEGRVQGPTTNVYTVNVLRDLAKRGLHIAAALQRKPLEESAAEAVKLGLPGTVTYFFVRNELCERCIKAWDVMADEFQKANHEGREPNIPPVDPIAVMQTAYVIAQSRAKFATLPFINTALVSTVDASHVKEGETHRYKGAGAIWSLGASDRIKSKVKH